MPETTRLEDIYTCLKSSGIDVYLQGQHKGECKNSYVVVKPGVSTPYLQLSTNVYYYDILCYTPEKHPTETERFKERVKNVLLDLYPMIQYADSETPPYFDDSVKGWMVDLTYLNYRKRESGLYQKS